MNHRPYSDSEAVVFAAQHTVDIVSFWFPIVLIEFLTIIFRLMGCFLFVGVAAKSFFGTSLNYPLIQTSFFDFSGFWTSCMFLGIAASCCLLFEFIGGIFDMGIMRIRLDIVDIKRSNLSRIFSCSNLALKHFLATLLFWIIVLSGLIFFVVPGVLLAVRLSFYRAILVETGCGPLQALKQSFCLTRGFFLPLLWTALIGVALVAPFLRGDIFMLTAFFTIPFLWLYQAFIYRSLRGMPYTA